MRTQKVREVHTTCVQYFTLIGSPVRDMLDRDKKGRGKQELVFTVED